MLKAGKKTQDANRERKSSGNRVGHRKKRERKREKEKPVPHPPGGELEKEEKQRNKSEKSPTPARRPAEIEELWSIGGE